MFEIDHVGIGGSERPTDRCATGEHQEGLERERACCSRADSEDRTDPFLGANEDGQVAVDEVRRWHSIGQEPHRDPDADVSLGTFEQRYDVEFADSCARRVDRKRDPGIELAHHTDEHRIAVPEVPGDIGPIQAGGLFEQRVRDLLHILRREEVDARLDQRLLGIGS